MKRIFLCSALLFCGILSAKDLKCGRWTFGVNDANGALQTISYDNLLLTDNRAGKREFNFSQPQMIPATPEGYTFDAKKQEAVFKSRNGRWYYEDTYRINGKRLERTFSFVYKGKKNETFDYLDLYWYLPAKGKFYFPLVFFHDTRSPVRMASAYSGDVTHGMLKDIPEKKVIGNSPEGLFAFFEVEPGKTLMIAMDGERDFNRTMMQREGSIIQLMMYTRICGWAEPNVPQSLNKITMEILPCSAEDALRTGPHQWFADYQKSVPADRPDWFLDNIMSIGMPAPSYSGSLNARTAQKTLLPYLAKRGYNTYWLMPVQPSFTYLPDDYLDVRKELGDWNDLREFTSAAHRNNIRVLLDVIPHGGFPRMAPKRGLSPWTLSIDKNGNFIRAMSYDYGSKEYRDYIAYVCREYLKRGNFDGFKVDQCGFSPDNWRLPDFPKTMPKNCPDKEWWDKAVKANNGVLPRNESGRASDGNVYVGKLMANNIRSVVREFGKDKFMLAEDNTNPMSWCGDAAYNYRLVQTRWKMHQMPAADFSSNLEAYLQERQFTEPKGTIRHGGLDGHSNTLFVDHVGVDAYLAIREAISWCRWSIMDSYFSICGMGSHIRRINLTKTALPELRRGEADYKLVASDPKMFTVARIMPEQSAVGLANFRPDAVETKINFSPVKLSFSPDTVIQICDVRNGELFWKGKAKDFKGITVPMARFGTRLLAVRKTGDNPKTIDCAPLAPANAEKAGLPQRDGKDFRIGSLVVSSETGLPKAFAGNLITGGDIFDDELPSSTQVAVSIAGNKICAKFPNQLEIDYSANPDGRIKMEISSPCTSTSRRQAVVLKSAAARRWTVNSAEGLLDEFHDPEFIEDTVPNFSHTNFIHQQGPVVFDSYRYALLPGALFSLADKDGKYIQIELADPLADSYDNVQILDSVPGDKSLHVAVFLTQPGPLSLAKKGSVRKATLLLGAGTGSKAVNRVQLGKYEFRNNSMYWSITHPSSKLEISRIGGTLRKFSAPGQEIVNGDYGMPGSGKHMLASENIRQIVRLYVENNVPHLRYSGRIGDPGMWEIVWSSIDYVFAADGTVTMNCYLNGDNVAPEKFAKPELFFTANGKLQQFPFGDIWKNGWTGLAVNLNKGTCTKAPELAFPEYREERFWSIGSVLAGKRLPLELSCRFAGNDVRLQIIANGYTSNSGKPGIVVYQPCRLARLDVPVNLQPGTFDLSTSVDAEEGKQSDCKLKVQLIYRYTDKDGTKKLKWNTGMLTIPSAAGHYEFHKKVTIPPGAESGHIFQVLFEATGGARKLEIHGAKLCPVKK